MCFTEADLRDLPVPQALAAYVERLELPKPEHPPYAITLVEGVNQHLRRIDETISTYAEGWNHRTACRSWTATSPASPSTSSSTSTRSTTLSSSRKPSSSPKELARTTPPASSTVSAGCIADYDPRD